MKPRRETDTLKPRGNMTNMTEENSKINQTDLSTGAPGSFFEIRVKGHLDESWSDWLDGLDVKLMDNGEMILSGPIRDQAALMGIINKLYRLNLPLLSLSEVK
jgi:hypothetical protein